MRGAGGGDGRTDRTEVTARRPIAIHTGGVVLLTVLVIGTGHDDQTHTRVCDETPWADRPRHVRVHHMFAPQVNPAIRAVRSEGLSTESAHLLLTPSYSRLHLGVKPSYADTMS